MHVDGGHRQKPIDFQRGPFQNGRLVAILDILVSRLEYLASNINSKLKWHNAYVYV